MSDTAAGPRPLEQVEEHKQFGGYNRRYKHDSTATGCKMTFSVYLPPASASGAPPPVLLYLSGLTCDDTNFIQKAGAQRLASKLGIALVAPDTSPRGLNIPGEAEAWDFGLGAGFYVNATQPKWKNWQMYDYCTKELPALLASSAPLSTQLDMSRLSIMGHSMGGHGAMMLALRNPGVYRSCSAFSPIANPVTVPWGVKCFTGYLGEDAESWKQYDSCELLAKCDAGAAAALPLLVDFGSADGSLPQLGVDALCAATAKAGYSPDAVRMHDGYDHAYFFISTFVDDHIAFHAKHLLA